MALIFLVLLSMLGVAAMQTATMEERMAGNLRNENLAFQAAEAALRDAEDLLGSAIPPTTFDGSDGLYDQLTSAWPGHDNPRGWEGWTATATPPPYREYRDDRNSADTSITGVAERPRYVIEKLPPVPSPSNASLDPSKAEYVTVYRITARAVGGTTNSVAILQSTFWGTTP